MSKPVISVENLSKLYRIGLKEEIPDTLVGAMTSFIKSPLANFRQLRRLDTFAASNNDNHEDTLWALKDVSFDIEEGDVVGIIGRNGAGKSTLLKILSRITEPTSGRIVMRGRVSSLLEVGTGFHPELSGRENIYMNGTILGMTKREIDSKFDEIVDFSGVERFLDTPVKRYSSGMMVRLAFAVAAHLEPEILIVDEVLAVGDAEFQKKCITKMQDVSGQGRTVLFVSHNDLAIKTLCKRGILFDSGELILDGTAKDTISAYHEREEEFSEKPKEEFNGTAKIKDITLTDNNGTETSNFKCGESAKITVHYSCESRTENVLIAIGIIHPTKGPIAQLNTEFYDHLIELSPPSGQITATIPKLILAPGRYLINATIADLDSRINIHQIASMAIIDITKENTLGMSITPTQGVGHTIIEHHWKATSVNNHQQDSQN